MYVYIHTYECARACARVCECVCMYTYIYNAHVSELNILYQLADVWMQLLQAINHMHNTRIKIRIYTSVNTCVNAC